MSQPDRDKVIHARLADLAAHTPGTYEAAHAWFTAQGPAIATELAKALDDPDLGSIGHWRVLLLLRHFAVESTLPAILKTLRDAALRRDHIVLPGAMEAAAVFRTPEANHALIDLLDLPDPDTVKHAAVLAGETGDPRALDPLRRLLDNTSPFVRYAAAKGLIALGSPAAHDALARHLEAESDPEVRALIQSAAGGAAQR